MKPETFTTHSLPVPDQFDAWRDWAETRLIASEPTFHSLHSAGNPASSGR